MLCRTYVCEDSWEGICTGIHHAWSRRHAEYRDKIATGTGETMELFTEYVQIENDRRKADSVQQMIRKFMGQDNFETIYTAAMSCAPEKADAILGTVVEATKLTNSKSIMGHLTCDSVRTVFELNRKVCNESHHYKMFIRFRELMNGILFAEITPQNRVLPLVMDHFENRFPLEDWAIYDHTKKEFLIHRKEEPSFFVSGEELDVESIKEFSEEEEYLEDMFRQFVKSISIKERENWKLQRQNMPIRFRKHMTEFD